MKCISLGLKPRSPDSLICFLLTTSCWQSATYNWAHKYILTINDHKIFPYQQLILALQKGGKIDLINLGVGGEGA